MKEFFSLSDEDIARKRTQMWARLESQLPERGVSEYQSVLRGVRQAHRLEVPRLTKAQLKERILDMLPEKKAPLVFWFSKKVWATSTLSLFALGIFLPVLAPPRMALASSVNVLEIAEGEVLLNGMPVDSSSFLKVGDTVETRSGSMAHLFLSDDSRLTLGPETRVQIQDLDDPVFYQESGRLWAQYVRPESPEDFLELRFPDGSVRMDQRAMVDVEVDEGTQVQVARNWVLVDVQLEDQYSGFLGEGAQMRVTPEMELSEIEGEEDLWWNFNLAYGKDHLRSLDESFKREAVERVRILPGNPLYKVKTFGESVKETLSFSTRWKESVQVQHAEKRLHEATVLMKQGDVTRAEAVMEDYVEQVEKNEESTLITQHVEQASKRVMEAPVKLQVEAASLSLAKNVQDKSEVRLWNASQELNTVPDLIADGDLETAATVLQDYQSRSRDLFTDMEQVSLEEREAVVSSVLNQRLKDLQTLRVISRMPEFDASLDTDEQVMQEMGLMVLSLRENSLEHLTDFFDNTDYDLDAQQELYTRLKDSSDLSPELSQQFEDVEAAIGEVAEKAPLMAVELVEEPEVDTRLLDLPHANEAEDETESGE
jgi:hypothetical protein